MKRSPVSGSRRDAILDAELHHLRRELEKRPRGLNRADLTRLYGDDRRARDLITALAERGMAAVIVLDDPRPGARGKIYRLAVNAAEVRAEQARLEAYAASLRARAHGVGVAWETGGAGQPELFEVPY